MQQSQYFTKVQYRKATIYIILIVLLFLLSIPFLGGKTQLFTRQIKVQIGKSTLIIIFIKEKDADSGGK